MATKELPGILVRYLFLKNQDEFTGYRMSETLSCISKERICLISRQFRMFEQ